MGYFKPESITQQFGVTAGMRVAEIGSGVGHFSLPLASAVGYNGKVYMIDTKGSLTSRAKKVANKEYGLDNMEAIRGDIESFRGSGIRKSFIDRAILINTLFQLHNKNKALEEIKRVIKPQGKFLVVDWGASYGNIGPYIRNVVNKKRTMEMLKDVGFECVKEIKAGDYHYGLVFEKTD